MASRFSFSSRRTGRTLGFEPGDPQSNLPGLVHRHGLEPFFGQFVALDKAGSSDIRSLRCLDCHMNYYTERYCTGRIMANHMSVQNAVPTTIVGSTTNRLQSPGNPGFRPPRSFSRVLISFWLSASRVRPISVSEDRPDYYTSYYKKGSDCQSPITTRSFRGRYWDR